MTQTWHDLLFAHWPVREESLRSLVPAQLSLDKFDGACWAGVVPFRMSGIRRRGMPPFPRLSQFPELNVRTYVVYEGKPGVYFFSLDAASRSAVWAARRFYHLPYFHAVMSCDPSSGHVNYDSCRITGGAAFRGRYRPLAKPRQSSPGTLEHWLTERYCLYSVFRGNVYRGNIHHGPWPLQTAEAEIEINTMAEVAGIPLPSRPSLLHFSRRLDVLVWPIKLT